MKTIPVVSQLDTVFGRGEGPVYCFREVAMDGNNVIPAEVSHPDAERFFGVYQWRDAENKWEWVADVATRELATQLAQTLAGTKREYVPDAMPITFAYLAIGYQQAFMEADSGHRVSLTWHDVLRDVLWQGHTLERYFYEVLVPNNNATHSVIANFPHFVSHYGRGCTRALMNPESDRTWDDISFELKTKAWEYIQ